MFVYSNESEQISENRIVFSADAVLEVEEDESFEAPVPALWDDRILRGIDVDQYDIYYICTHPRRTGQYNSVIDFKKVWKLSNLPKGILDGAYDADEGRVYWGVYKARGEEGFRKHLSPTLLLSPRAAEPLNPDSLYALWKKYRLGFGDALPEPLVNELNPAKNSRYLLHYAHVLSNPSLEIWGPNADTVFSQPHKSAVRGL